MADLSVVKWTRLRSRFSVGLLRRSSGVLAGRSVELWRGTGLPYEPTTGLSNLDVSTILEHPMLPRAVGDQHAELPNTEVLFKDVVKGPWCGKVTVAVVFGPRPFLSFAGPRLYGYMSGQQGNILIEQPNYSRDQSNVLTWAPRPLQRKTLVRRRAFLVTVGASAGDLADAYEANVGKAYAINYPGSKTIPFLLQGYQFADPQTGNQGQAVLIVESITYCPVPAVAPAPPHIAVTIPALDYLEEYNPPRMETPLPSLTAFLPNYEAGDNLPHGP